MRGGACRASPRRRVRPERDQNAPAVAGVPSPVGPSQPPVAVQRMLPQAPLLPDVTSFSAATFAYGSDPAAGEPVTPPASANTEAMTGAPTLVPPTINQPLLPWNETLSNTETPVPGSASAETSATARAPHTLTTFRLAACQLGCASKALQPLPAPLQAVSDQPRATAGSFVRVVPPTAVTNGEAAGYWTPKPPSPELAVMAMVGWLKCASRPVSALSSAPP